MAGNGYNGVPPICGDEKIMPRQKEFMQDPYLSNLSTDISSSIGTVFEGPENNGFGDKIYPWNTNISHSLDLSGGIGDVSIEPYNEAKKA